MIRCHLTAYPWDMIQEGVEAVLDYLQGEIGATGLSLWVAAPPLVQVRPREIEPRIFRTRGGLFFPPDGPWLEGTRCKPVVATDLKHGDALTKVADACHRRGLELRVVVSASRTGRLAERHPEMACRNALGDRSHLSVCLGNPDVQAYLTGLTTSVSERYDISGVIVTDFVIAWAEASGSELLTGVVLGDRSRELLQTCFCESCYRQAADAGVDVDGAREIVQAMLQESFDTGRMIGEEQPGAVVNQQPLADYYRSRAQMLSVVLDRMVDRCECDLILDRRLDPSDRRRHAGPDLSKPAGVRTTVYKLEDIAEGICKEARANELHLSVEALRHRHAEELVGAVRAAADKGFSVVETGNYGLLAKDTLNSIRQAFRYARR